MTLTCPHRPPCPGCPRLEERTLAPRAAATLEALARSRGLAGLHVVRGADVGFRHRARIAIRGRTRSPKLGIFEAGSHRIVDIPRCLVHHPLVNDVAAAVRDTIRETGTPTYSDEAHLGLARYLQVVVERASTTAQVVIVTNSDSPESCRPLLDAVTTRLGDRLHSLFWNGNPARANVILGPHWHRVTGPEAVEESIGGARIFYPPGAFGQSHLELADALVELCHGWVPDGARVAEFYAGVGAIGLGLSVRVSELVANEVAEESLRGLEQGISALEATARARVRIVPGAAGAVTAAGRISTSTEVVIVDPPRKGLDAELLAALVQSPPDRLIYVACGLDSFLSDEATLHAAGQLRLTSLSAFDMFPHTDHIETLARFDRP